MKLKQKLNKIKEYYEQAWLFIESNDYKSATYIIYEKMGIDLYDISLDIMYRNGIGVENNISFDSRDKDEFEVFLRDLRDLIVKVDRKLCQESKDGLEDEFEDDLTPIEVNSEESDAFTGDTF